MSEYAIEVENLSVCYKGLKSFSIKKNLLRRKQSRKELFCALKNVSFKLEKGEILGIVGKNGSGKSTEDVACAEVDPGGLVVGLFLNSLQVILGQLVALLFPFLGIEGIAQNIGKLHVALYSFSVIRRWRR